MLQLGGTALKNQQQQWWQREVRPSQLTRDLDLQRMVGMYFHQHLQTMRARVRRTLR